jgi:hypothetical protein
VTTFTEEVRDTLGSTKFSDNRRAAAAHLLSMDTSWLDEETGSTGEWTLWCARLGRTLLIEDEYGFVTCDRYATVKEAEQAFALIANEYIEFCDASDHML